MLVVTSLLFCAAWGILISLFLLPLGRIGAKPTPAPPRRSTELCSIRVRSVFGGRGIPNARYFFLADAPEVRALGDRLKHRAFMN